MKYYYADAQNRSTGPVELDQLRQLQSSGAIHALTAVIPEGSTQWSTLGAVLSAAGVAPAAAPSPGPAPATAPAAVAPKAASPSSGNGFTQLVDQVSTLLAGCVDWILGLARRVLSPAFLTGLFAGATRAGHITVLLGAVLGLIYSIVLAVRANSFGAFGMGLGLIVVIAILQYVALRFLTATAALVRTSPSRVGSAAVLDCLALVLIVAAIGSLFSGTYVAIRSNEFMAFLTALVTCALCLVAAGVTLNPSLSNVRIEESSAGEEAIGLLSFFAKAGLVVLPLQFALVSLLGVLAIVTAFFNSGGYSVFSSVGGMLPFLPSGQGDAGMVGIAILAYACALPLFSYLAFLFYYLVLDLIRAVLDVPRKLDRLAR